MPCPVRVTGLAPVLKTKLLFRSRITREKVLLVSSTMRRNLTGMRSLALPNSPAPSIVAIVLDGLQVMAINSLPNKVFASLLILVLKVTLAWKLQPGQALNPRLKSSPLEPAGKASIGIVPFPPPVAKHSHIPGGLVVGGWVVGGLVVGGEVVGGSVGATVVGGIVP